MAITLTYQGTTRPLSDRLVWSDEHAWQPVAMEADRGTRGDHIVWVRARQAGRPITLEGEASNAWMTLAEIQALQAWAALPGAQFTLHLRGADHAVLFDHTQGPAITARPLWPLADGEQQPDMPMRPAFRFITVS
jgi:hypothetical protein